MSAMFVSRAVWTFLDLQEEEVSRHGVRENAAGNIAATAVVLLLLRSVPGCLAEE